MLEPIVVREYARLTTCKLERNTLDEAHVSSSVFKWLCELSQSFRRSGAQLLQLDGQQWLKLDSYVGVLESPCGQVIEILPKHHDEGDSEQASRALLRKLIRSMLDVPSREAQEASLSLYDAPIAEWIIGQFLSALEYLLKKGIRFDYKRIEEEQCYLKGQLDTVKQMRQPPGRQHLFQLRHDVFLADRAENRLLKSALLLVTKTTQHPDNWRLSREILVMLSEIPESLSIEQDFRQWRNDRLMAHYQTIKPWCELLLYQHMPMAVSGTYRGISLLFPMEKLFENHVARVLVRQLMKPAKLRSQVANKYLCSHQGKAIFQLKPDILIELDSLSWVLDTKWKRLDTANRKTKYGLSQGDFYQMLAYSRSYLLEGKGEMVLIYPKTKTFSEPLEPFVFDDELVLQIWPFDLENDELLVGCGASIPLIQISNEFL